MKRTQFSESICISRNFFNSKYVFLQVDLKKNIFWKIKKCRTLRKVLKINENPYMDFHWFLVLFSMFDIFWFFKKCFFSNRPGEKHIWSWKNFGICISIQKIVFFSFLMFLASFRQPNCFKSGDKVKMGQNLFFCTICKIWIL